MQSHGQKRTPEGKSLIHRLSFICVANMRLWLDREESRIGGSASASVTQMSLNVGVGTMLHVALRSPHPKSFRSATRLA